MRKQGQTQSLYQYFSSVIFHKHAVMLMKRRFLFPENNTASLQWVSRLLIVKKLSGIHCANFSVRSKTTECFLALLLRCTSTIDGSSWANCFPSPKLGSTTDPKTPGRCRPSSSSRWSRHAVESDGIPELLDQGLVKSGCRLQRRVDTCDSLPSQSCQHVLHLAHRFRRR